MRVIIAGGRDLEGDAYYEEVVHALADAIREWEVRQLDEIITGGQTGIDQLGKDLAENFGIAHHEEPAEWDEHGLAAGPIRNRKMAKRGDALVLVWTGHSKGSRSMLHIAQEEGLKIHERIVE